MTSQGIEHFTKEQFEVALPHHNVTGKPLCEYTGLVDGEHTYRMPVGTGGKMFIAIRSSIWANGNSADTGKNSIRAWLVDADGKTLSSKTQKYVNRLPGWPVRTADMLRKLYKMAIHVGLCPHCGQPKHIFMIKKQTSEHYGRWFAKCITCKDNGWVWLDEVLLPEPKKTKKERKNVQQPSLC